MKFSSILVLVMAFILGSTARTLAQSTTDKVTVSETTTTINAKVKGITCSSDLKIISTNVEKLEGVTSCKAGKTGPTTTFKITYAPNLVTDKEIYSAIQNSGSCENPDERPYKVKH